MKNVKWPAQHKARTGHRTETRTDAVAVMREMGPMPAGNEPNVKVSGAVTECDQRRIRQFISRYRPGHGPRMALPAQGRLSCPRHTAPRHAVPRREEDEEEEEKEDRGSRGSEVRR